jgi:hypothetical protein
MDKGTNGGSLRVLGTHDNRIGKAVRMNWRVHCFAEKHRKNHIFGDFVNPSAKPSVIAKMGPCNA